MHSPFCPWSLLWGPWEYVRGALQRQRSLSLGVSLESVDSNPSGSRSQSSIWVGAASVSLIRWLPWCPVWRRGQFPVTVPGWLKQCRFVPGLCLTLTMQPQASRPSPSPHYDEVDLGPSYGFFQLLLIQCRNGRKILVNTNDISNYDLSSIDILRLCFPLLHWVLVQETLLSCGMLFTAACCRQSLSWRPLSASGSFRVPQDFRFSCFFILNPMLALFKHYKISMRCKPIAVRHLAFSSTNNAHTPLPHLLCDSGYIIPSLVSTGRAQAGQRVCH